MIMRVPVWPKLVVAAGLLCVACPRLAGQQPASTEILPRIAFSHQSAAAATAKKKSARNVDGIMDNSFLVEEAYNQEAGVVQHIFNGIYGLNRAPGADDRTFDFVFTQEWPVFSQKHQFSYAVPYSYAKIGGQSEDGLGDILLNYRYQAYFNEETLTAFAPRFSLVLPTGSATRGLGEDTLGYQLNLPVSSAIGNRWFVHGNAGLTHLPNAASAGERDLLHYHLGASAIYAPTRDLHFLLEWIGVWNHGPAASGNLEREFESVISPGVRRAINCANGTQVVLGLAVPVGLTAPTPDVGVFLYLSIEHGFLKGK